MSTNTPLRLGTRNSALARWQAQWVATQLTHRGHTVELIPMSTTGDVRAEPIETLGNVGLFTKEIQRALLDETVDLAVHSLKDLPTEPTDGLSLAAVPLRARVSDALVSNQFDAFQDLPPKARIGTGSLRRRAQLLHVRPDLQLLDIRGNVDTRLGKLDSGQYDAIVLAAAGLERLELSERISQILPHDLMLPAVGQGALGVETRTTDESTRAAVGGIDDLQSHWAILAERSLLAQLQGGCLAPVGAWARMNHGGDLVLQGVVLSRDGTQRIAAEGELAILDAESSSAAAVQFGQSVADDLLSQGAAELIHESRAED